MPKKNNTCFKIAIFTNRGNEERRNLKHETKIAIIEHKEKAKLTK